ncbi:MAG: DEAD/DEAH box helicase, partial [Microcystaceae cyanobacterium]
MKTQGVKTQQGDYSASDVAAANPVIELSGNLVKSYCQHANGKRCVVFAVNVEHSQAIAARYIESGIPAAHLDGTTPTEERQETLEQFRQGKIKVISNCQLFDEGLDIPALEAVQIAKPTKSLSRWLQMVGRSLRPAEGKDYAVILDHTKNWAIHGLPTRDRAWTLAGVEELENKKKQIGWNLETGEVLEFEVQETESLLEEIEEPATETTAIADKWMLWFQEVLHHQQVSGFKPGWIYYQLVEAKPPLHIWEKFAELRGYKKSWA